MTHLVATLDPWPFGVSIAIGGLTCYLLLDLAQRVKTSERGIARLWWGGGSLVAGTGLWGAHFLAMTARVLPIPVGYTASMTLLSWLCGVGAAGLALAPARPRERSALRLVGSAGACTGRKYKCTM